MVTYTATQIGAILHEGGVAAFPTETAYGIGALARDPAAIRRLVETRGREPGKPLIALVRDLDEARLLAREIPPDAARLAAAFWPGPLTIVLPARAGLPEELTAGTGTVGVRATSSGAARRLIALAGGPIVAPSANRPGGTPAIDASAVRAAFPQVPVLDGGALRSGPMSTVVAVAPLRVLREGRILEKAIRAVVRV